MLRIVQETLTVLISAHMVAIDRLLTQNEQVSQHIGSSESWILIFDSQKLKVELKTISRCTRLLYSDTISQSKS